jgi:protein-L-isoaspartate(D-aspartate) O-methyltransferase
MIWWIEPGSREEVLCAQHACEHGLGVAVNVHVVTEASAGLLMVQSLEEMVTLQIEARGVNHPRVLAAMRHVDRALFFPPAIVEHAYADGAFAVGNQQTISQPYIVALMTQLLDPQPGDRVLEIGTGTGYQTAILAELSSMVYSVEAIAHLADTARARLARLGYANVQILRADGYAGMTAEAPFNRILVTAAPAEIPGTLVEQLAVGGRLVAPVGVGEQTLIVVDKCSPRRWTQRTSAAVRFVPMVHYD